MAHLFPSPRGPQEDFGTHTWSFCSLVKLHCCRKRIRSQFCFYLHTVSIHTGWNLNCLIVTFIFPNLYFPHISHTFSVQPRFDALSIWTITSERGCSPHLLQIFAFYNSSVFYMQLISLLTVFFSIKYFLWRALGHSILWRYCAYKFDKIGKVKECPNFIWDGLNHSN